MNKELNCSIDLPLEEQFGENRGWENSNQRYELDTMFQDKEYFQDMDPEDLCHLVRKMDNFLMERGLTYYFLNNYFLAIQAFKNLDEIDNDYPNSEYCY